MNILNAENVYLSLTGELREEYAIDGVENAFAEGSLCDRLYREVYQANLRLCKCLGQAEADRDVETIINNLLEINKQIGLKMYHYGQKFAGERER